jgi:hypothetical protein
MNLNADKSPVPVMPVNLIALASLTGPRKELLPSRVDSTSANKEFSKQVKLSAGKQEF